MFERLDTLDDLFTFRLGSLLSADMATAQGETEVAQLLRQNLAQEEAARDTLAAMGHQLATVR